MTLGRPERETFRTTRPPSKCVGVRRNDGRARPLTDKGIAEKCPSATPGDSRAQASLEAIEDATRSSAPSAPEASNVLTGAAAASSTRLSTRADASIGGSIQR